MDAYREVLGGGEMSVTGLLGLWRGGGGGRHDRGDRRLLTRYRRRKRQAVRVTGPEYECCCEQNRRQYGRDASAFERQQISYDVRGKGKHRQHRDIEPVHPTKID